MPPSNTIVVTGAREHNLNQRNAPRELEILAGAVLLRDCLPHLGIDEPALIQRNGQREPDDRLARVAATPSCTVPFEACAP